MISTHAPWNEGTSNQGSMSGTHHGKAHLSWAGCVLLVGTMFGGIVPSALADAFTPPTKEELAMKALDGYPNAAAVVLFREEITKDDLHSVLHYERIKILTEEGKKYANVELAYVSTHDSGYDSSGDDKTADSIQGRTIHADGTIIPFTGKPYLKTLESGKKYKVQEKVFTLPDVEVGSIVEYRYATRINDNIYEAPSWLLQGDLFLKKAHYVWYPTTRELQDGETGALVNSIAWFPILRKEDHFEQHQLATGQRLYELSVADVPPLPKEEFMPPTRYYSLRLLFSFTQYHSADDFWKDTAKHWSKGVNSFAGPNGDLRSATEKIVAGATTDDEKLHRIYATVMSLENTAFTRERDEREDKANGSGKTNNAADVLAHKRGSPWQLTELFIGMARAAGLSAYGVWVPDRSIELVTKGWLSTSQFDDLIAIVKVDGKEQFFDPGSRYQPYGRLAWEHTFLPTVLRQTDGGTDWGTTPGDAYPANVTQRIANLTMDESGKVTGSIDMTYTGAPGVRWRQAALRGDNESVRKQLEESLQEMLPRTIEVKVESLNSLDDYEKPLVVKFTTTGTLGTMTGKRMVLPVDLFTAGGSATFPHEKRDAPVYFHYAAMTRDALRINLPKTLTPEAVPDAAKYSLPQEGGYSLSVTYSPAQFTTRRDMALNSILVSPADYTKLRAFYTQFETKDQESVVLKPGLATTVTSIPVTPEDKTK
ncbi:Transglutaminase-like superfamily protein [Bryocella elongata]|uniref:Transglutaminase-like superfamily protein n=1 Tax=Bryocella elongata TaxID=863522 RepID=A0A1H5SIB5_9BACT|nr:DUF3857 domain-containing protein [Bryocella elongata]SEF50154.1 Transglutaminase-like superfamily protein [Bryocella elongata]